MSVFGNISCQIKKFFIQEVDFDHVKWLEISLNKKGFHTRIYFDRSVCKAAGHVSAVLTNAQLLGEKRTCVKYQTGMAKSTHLVTLIIYICIFFIRSPMFPSDCSKLHKLRV